MYLLIGLLFALLIAGVMLNVLGQPLWAVAVLGLAFIVSALYLGKGMKK